MSERSHLEQDIEYAVQVRHIVELPVWKKFMEELEEDVERFRAEFAFIDVETPEDRRKFRDMQVEVRSVELLMVKLAEFESRGVDAANAVDTNSI